MFEEIRKRLTESVEQLPGGATAYSYRQNLAAEDVKLLLDFYDDLSRTFDEFINHVWGLIYPNDPTGWEYPGQAKRHIEQLVNEQKAEIARLQAEAGNIEALERSRFKPEKIFNVTLSNIAPVQECEHVWSAANNTAGNHYCTKCGMWRSWL